MQVTTERSVYVDEAGGTELGQTRGAEPLYVLAGVLVDNCDLDEYRQRAGRVVREHAGTGELKSKNIGSNTARRRRVIESICSAGFSSYSLVINKTKIFGGSGLRFRASFYKFLHNLFYERITRGLSRLNIVADDYGSKEYMRSFKKYVDSHGLLFENFQFRSARQEPLLQIADVIAGTVRRVYSRQDPLDILETISGPVLAIEEWPPPGLRYKGDQASTTWDEVIQEYAMDSASRFVEEHLSADSEDERMQGLVMRYLLERCIESPREYVFRSEISGYLKGTGYSVSDREVTTNALAKARDAGVIICSSEKGVKIPISQADIEAWVGHVGAQVVPLLKRLQTARNDLLKMSQGQYDIVRGPGFEELSRYLKALPENRTECAGGDAGDGL